MLRRVVEALGIMGALLTAASPAFAGRGTQIDVLVPSSSCSLGSTTCSPFDISRAGLPSGLQSAYLYDNGIVSLGSMLPASAVAGDPSSFGSGIWFTPGFDPGTTYTVSVYQGLASGPRPISWGFNFFAAGSPTVDQFGHATAPDMQVLLSSGTGTYFDPSLTYGNWNGITVTFAYSPNYVPPENALIGFSWGDGATQFVRNADGLLVGSSPSDTDFVSTAFIYQPGGVINLPGGGHTIVEPSWSSPTQFTPRYADVAPGAVPEPATWAMMLLGFGLMGVALRRRLPGTFSHA